MSLLLIDISELNVLHIIKLSTFRQWPAENPSLFKVISWLLYPGH